MAMLKKRAINKIAQLLTTKVFGNAVIMIDEPLNLALLTTDENFAGMQISAWPAYAYQSGYY